MRVIIIGAGRIGTSLAKSLSQENNEVYLIEKNKQVARKKGEKLDVKMIVGNAADPDVLKKAQVQEAELVLAVSTSDETNLVVCSLAGLFGAKGVLQESVIHRSVNRLNSSDMINLRSMKLLILN